MHPELTPQELFDLGFEHGQEDAFANVWDPKTTDSNYMEGYENGHCSELSNF